MDIISFCCFFPLQNLSNDDPQDCFIKQFRTQSVSNTKPVKHLINSKTEIFASLNQQDGTISPTI